MFAQTDISQTVVKNKCTERLEFKSVFMDLGRLCGTLAPPEGTGVGGEHTSEHIHPHSWPQII